MSTDPSIEPSDEDFRREFDAFLGEVDIGALAESVQAIHDVESAFSRIKYPAMPKSEPPVDGMTVVPYGLPLMREAWASCVLWAAGHDECIARFEAETGLKYVSPRTPLDAAIDKSTGLDKKIAARFADWVTKNIWGEEENG